jgi:uncharacterized membrane protein
VEELVMLGFGDKFRAVEVLPQLQRLKFDWSTDLRTAIAVEVENDNRLRLHHSQLLDPAAGLEDVVQWTAILNAIIPLPHTPPDSTAETAYQASVINSEGRSWLRKVSLDREFMRNAAALLRPGNSAIFALVRHSESALKVLSGDSQIVLHTSFARFRSGTESTP